MGIRTVCLWAGLALAGLALRAAAGEIHEAIEAGDLARVAALIRANSDVVHEVNTNRLQDYPIHTAAIAGQVEIARMLLDAGAELEAGDVDNSTPLHDACIYRHREMVALLLERGADVNRRDYHAGYGLSFAASGGDTAIVRMVLDAGADLWYRGGGGLTLLHFAASRGLEDLVDTLLAIGEPVNVRSARGETPLVWAATRGQLPMVEKLLAHGARPNLGNEWGETPLHNAAARGNLEVGRLLLAWGADPNAAQTGWNATPLLYTTWDGHAEFARLLLAHGADVNHRADNHTTLNRAITAGHADLVNVLLEAGADLGVREADFDYTPLHLAAVRGYTDIAASLLQHGAPLDVQSRAGDTPMTLAARYGHADVVTLLGEHGAQGRVPAANQGLAAFADLPRGEAAIWFLEHSGWGIKTQNHLLIFDYFERNRAPGAPGLCNGHIHPAELAGEKVTVFVSHEHGDHYDQRIWDWREEIPAITYVFGFEPEGDELAPYELIGARQTRTFDGVKVTAIESNDSGAGFWVEVDGLTILHPGDHANRMRDLSGTYPAEIDWLAEIGRRPDIAFFPISGCNFGDQVAVKIGVHYALETLQPKVFLPMHGGDLTNRYQAFMNECRDQFPQTQMAAAAIRGDRFHYSNGNLAALALSVD